MKSRRILLLMLLIICFTITSFAGIEWQSTLTTDAKGKKADNKIISHIYASKGNLKQEFTSVDREDPYHSQDGYWLFKAKDDMIYIVNDKEKSYTALSVDSLLQLTGMVGKLVKIKIEDHTINTQMLPSEKINGVSCNHMKVTTQYTMKMKIAIVKTTMKVHEVKEIWATRDIPAMAEINKSFMNKNYKTGFEDLDKMIQKEQAQMNKLGFPMKMITTNIQKNKKGKVKGETTTIMEVTKIKSRNFPSSFFSIPKDYKETEGPNSGKKKFGLF